MQKSDNLSGDFFTHTVVSVVIWRSRTLDKDQSFED